WGGITCRGSNTAITLADQVLVAQFLLLTVTPGFAGPPVHALGESLGQPVSQCLGHNRVVIVLFALELLHQRFNINAGGYRERTQVILDAGSARRNEVGKGIVVLALRLDGLLAQGMKRSQHARARLIGIDLDILPDTRGG